MEPLPEMIKSAGDKIAESGAHRHAQPARVASSSSSQLTLLDVPGVVTVRLDASGRYFFCPSCKRSHRHPPDDLEFYMIGYGFCVFRCEWMVIEGGDDLGVVRVDERGRLYTVERDAREGK
jgi:hypothetical protein